MSEDEAPVIQVRNYVQLSSRHLGKRFLPPPTETTFIAPFFVTRSRLYLPHMDQNLSGPHALSCPLPYP
ncbi:hypothetical protein NL676_001312 [Syzygium grande]|nr:hypothetical protein NL676_001312 [Syzygium grande]